MKNVVISADGDRKVYSVPHGEIRAHKKSGVDRLPKEATGALLQLSHL